MMKSAVVIGLVLLSGTSALAEVVDADQAAAMIYPPKAGEVELLPTDALKRKEAKVLGMVAADQPYYAAIAISPDEGLMSEATVAAANYHDTDSAAAAALAECNAKKKGAADCVVAAIVRPDGWEARPLQLSSDASAAFGKAGGGAVAVSAATGSWGLGADEAAALADCTGRNPAATDCVAVIRP